MPTDHLSVAMGEEFTIPLRSIATAGYLWKIQSLPGAIEFLKTENEERAEDAKPGNATHQLFRFQAKQAGKHKIMFILARPWEKKAIESRAVTVKVT